MSSDMMQLLILFLLAAVVLYKLKSVIGTRTGHEAPPEYLQRGQDDDDDAQAPVEISGAGESDEVAANMPDADKTTLAQIQEVEPGFDLNGFLNGARGAYEMILMAYEEGDRATLQSLLAPDVFQAFEQGISAREEAGLRVEARFIGVRDARVEELVFDKDSNIADVSIRFVGELITAVYDAENHVVEGDPNEIRRQSDVWTFSREMGLRDPNWLLTGTGD